MNVDLLVFWGIIVIMTLVAVMFVVLPWFKITQHPVGDRKDFNIAVYRERLSELETALDYPNLTLAQREQEQQVIMQELLADVDAGDIVWKNSPGDKNGRWALFFLVLILPITALVLYSQIGSGLYLLYSEDTSSAHSGKDFSLEEIVAKLAARLNDNPNDQQGWILLARSYNTLENYSQASDAYSRAYALGGEYDATFLIEYAETLVLASNNQITAAARNLLNTALQKEPNHPQGLWLKGIWEFHDESYATAIESWQKLISILPADSEFIEKIQAAIREANRRLPQNNPPIIQE